MSEKITPLHPEKERKRKIRRKILSLIGLLVLVLAAVAVILFHEQMNFDKLRRYITYLNVKDSSDYGTYSFDDHSANAYAAYSDGLAVASVAGLEFFGPSGESLLSVPASMGAPVLSVGDKLSLAWDAGGTTVLAASPSDGAALRTSVTQPLLDADISEGDWICYASPEDGYKTVLTVLDSKQNSVYRWYSSSQYLPLCAISDNGGTMAAVALGPQDGVFTSSVQLFPTNQEDPGPSVSLGNQLILDLDFVEGKRLCAVGEESIQFVDTDGNLTGTYSYGGNYLEDFDLTGNGFITLALNQYQAGSRYTVVTVDHDGVEVGRLPVENEVLSISAAGNYVAVLTSDQLRIYREDLSEYAQTSETYGASRVEMRSDGTALLISSGSAHLYLP